MSPTAKHLLSVLEPFELDRAHRARDETAREETTLGTNMWHIEAKRSWWDGSAIALCGAKFKSGEYVSDFWVIPATGPRCKACERAAKRK